MIETLALGSAVIVAGHRGYKSEYPENTILAFEKALELGVDMIEFDLRLSKDGFVVIIHDETVNRTTNGTGEVSSFSLAELKQLDAGGWFNERFAGLPIPTLEELCELLERYPHVLLNVEIKPSIHSEEVADKAVALLETKELLDRCVFTSFDANLTAYLHRTYGVRMQGFPEQEMHNFKQGPEGTYSQMWAIGIHMPLLTPEAVERYKTMGLLPWCYCPDNAEQVEYALGCGVTLMTCNDPVPAMQAVKPLNESLA
ncbi:glycerophosphodiester phosphodiesterase family protein [Cohnella lupini]|uniref:Glycerophosphoryl diester phosphodiesterase n=1 Tax=Cohnella lupini TaxID=1294267 RepID=A0A3D9IXM5_9BACL|nr:glycerophosphodiester phosphodiesterase family protein [Cohnella lupini]RED66367.1 glycerophosphoryl diester phosphodiesterase [Cohnella lupini]